MSIQASKPHVRPITHKLISGAAALLIAVAGFGVSAVTPASAASSGTCDLSASYNGSTTKISGVSCNSAKARPWIKYYANDVTTKVTRKDGSWVTSGSSSVSRPSGSFSHSGGFQIANA